MFKWLRKLFGRSEQDEIEQENHRLWAETEKYDNELEELRKKRAALEQKKRDPKLVAERDSLQKEKGTFEKVLFTYDSIIEIHKRVEDVLNRRKVILKEYEGEMQTFKLNEMRQLLMVYKKQILELHQSIQNAVGDLPSEKEKANSTDKKEV